MEAKHIELINELLKRIESNVYLKANLFYTIIAFCVFNLIFGVIVSFKVGVYCFQRVKHRNSTLATLYTDSEEDELMPRLLDRSLSKKSSKDLKYRNRGQFKRKKLINHSPINVINRKYTPFKISGDNELVDNVNEIKSTEINKKENESSSLLHHKIAGKMISNKPVLNSDEKPLDAEKKDAIFDQNLINAENSNKVNNKNSNESENVKVTPPKVEVSSPKAIEFGFDLPIINSLNDSQTNENKMKNLFKEANDESNFEVIDVTPDYEIPFMASKESNRTFIDDEMMDLTKPKSVFECRDTNSKTCDDENGKFYSLPYCKPSKSNEKYPEVEIDFSDDELDEFIRKAKLREEKMISLPPISESTKNENRKPFIAEDINWTEKAKNVTDISIPEQAEKGNYQKVDKIFAKTVEERAIRDIDERIERGMYPQFSNELSKQNL